MKFSTAKEHRDFFQKHGWIEFEKFISDDQLNALNQAIEEVLAERLGVALPRLKTLSSEKWFLEGHDLWRDHPFLQKFVAHARFSEIAAELIEKRPLRLGSDQLFLGRPKTASSTVSSLDSPKVYAHFLDQITSLQEVSCLRGVVCGVMISLNNQKGKEEESEKSEVSEVIVPVEEINVFPNECGSVIFFQPQSPIHWAQLLTRAGQRFYMIVFTQQSAYYQLESRDPHTHTLKRLGYILNDKLNDRLHPIVFR